MLQRMAWSAVRKKSFHTPLASASAIDSAPVAATTRGPATSASASGAMR